MWDAPAPATHYQLCEGVLGKGAYGTVVKAVNVQTQESFAVKRFKVTNKKVRTTPSARERPTRHARATPQRQRCARSGWPVGAMPSAEDKLDGRMPAADILGVRRCRGTSCARLRRYGPCRNRNTQTSLGFMDSCPKTTSTPNRRLFCSSCVRRRWSKSSKRHTKSMCARRRRPATALASAA